MNYDEDPDRPNRQRDDWQKLYEKQEAEIERLKGRVDELLEHNTSLRLELRATDRKRMVREFHAKFEDLFRVVDKFSIKIDFPRFVDGLVDLGYVLESTCVSLGINSTPLWREVQRANLAKDGKDERGKIKKPDGWTSPDVEGELRKQGYRG